MAGEAVLIAAFSGRALAQSARRAGYVPLVADAFGDLDTRDSAAAVHVIDGAMAAGFRTRPLIHALDALAQSISIPPIGLVLGSGFEDKPRLIAALGHRYRLIGNEAATYKACKDPAVFFARLDELGIAHPTTQPCPPDTTKGWLTKRVGGSGGRHIRSCDAAAGERRRRYFQKQISGDRLSVGGVFGTEHAHLALSRQWIAPSPDQAFRFGGAVSMPDVAPDLRSKLESAARDVASAFGIVGMASFDFIISGGTPHLLEVNPRPGASLDVLDDEQGALFRAHIAACLGISQADDPPLTPKTARAMAILHADRGSLTLGSTPWPAWSADRGQPGTYIPKGAPIASVFAEAASADAAEALARTRLAELEDLIYEHTQS
ncbi:MAG: ATP-grasp domain-containing protein [Hyphomicrobium sp.]|uniref:ATP-grasp domain-containing protein n=1 Tax=Hyphomicrobium sp. TaxID=82 RepID=UPI003561B4CA